jgi:hypothetical protein
LQESGRFRFILLKQCFRRSSCQNQYSLIGNICNYRPADISTFSGINR